MLVNWVPPNENQVALNVGESYLGSSGRACFGGLIRDHTGSWIVGVSGHIDCADSVEAELKGIEIGLMFAWELGYRDVSCRTDCWHATRLIQDSTSQSHKYVEIKDSIKEVMSRDWIVSLVWTHKESNQCADILTKWQAYQCMDYMAKMGGITEKKPPPCLSSLPSSDANRTTYVRA